MSKRNYDLKNLQWLFTVCQIKQDAEDPEKPQNTSTGEYQDNQNEIPSTLQVIQDLSILYSEKPQSKSNNKNYIKGSWYLRNRLSECGLRCYRSFKKCKLTELQRLRRRAWATRWRDFDFNSVTLILQSLSLGCLLGWEKVCYQTRQHWENLVFAYTTIRPI